MNDDTSTGALASVTDGSNLDKRNTVLTVNNLTKQFGGVVANDQVSLAVESGTITGLIGPNGAGKSTLFDCITGFYTPDVGRVTINGDDVTGDSPHQIARRGLVRSFQTPRKLEGMTVREAMLVAPQGQLGESIIPLFTQPSAVRAEERASLSRAEELLGTFEIDHLATALSTELSGGQTKLLEIARAMMADPDLLLLDEPVSGINPTLAEKIKTHIRQLNEDGITMFIIEHDMEFIMEMADPIIVLDQGSVLVEGPPEGIKGDERVIDAYLGGAVS